MSYPSCVDPDAEQTRQSQEHFERISGLNTYKIADTFSENTKSIVLILDYFNGDSMNPNARNLYDELLGMIEKKHPPTDAFTIGEKFLSVIKGRYQTIRLMAFFYGGKVVINMISHPELLSTIKSTVVAHPSFLVKEETNQVKRPILFLCAENDFTFTPDTRQEFEKVLNSNSLDTFIEYPGATHSFVCKPHGPEAVLEQNRKALQAGIQYFENNL